MIRTRLFAALGALLATALLTGCAHLGLGGPSDEEQTLQLLRDYEAAIAAYDADAAMDLLADDYEGWRGSGKEGITRFVDWLEENGWTLKLDLTEAVVTVEGDTATVAGVVSLLGEWESSATYVLTRTDDGWKIKDVEMRR